MLGYILTRRISATVRYRGMVSLDHLQKAIRPVGPSLLQVQRSTDWKRHVTPKGQGRAPKFFEVEYLVNRKKIE